MTNEIIVLDKVTYTYPGTTKPAVKDVSFTIKKGEIVLITGPSGAGKTTLCSMLNGIVPNSYGGELTGKVLVKGNDITKYSIGQMAFVSGMLFQDPSGQLINPTVEDEIAFGPENKGIPVEEVNKSIDKYIGYVNMENYRKRPSQALSGGQQQSVAFASVLAMEPDIYVLDEPTSNLDPLGSNLVFQLIKKIVDDEKRTAIIVEHKIEKVIDLVDRIIVMKDGAVVFDGKPSEVMSNYSVLLDMGVIPPQVTQITSKIIEEGLGNITCTTRLDEAVHELKKILPENLSKEVFNEVAVTFPSPPVYTNPVIRIRDLKFNYTPELEVLHGINADIYEGEFVSIVGQNGSGKTTIVKHLNGLLKPTSGTVEVYGEDTRNCTVSYLSTKVGYCFQNPDHQIFSSKVWDEIAYGPKNLGWSSEQIQDTVKNVGKILEIDHLFDENPYNLSKGQRQQIAVAAILAMKPNVIIVDEPTTGQDPKQSRKMMDLMKSLNKDYRKTIVVITHDMNIAAEYSDRIIVMHSGSIIAEGTPRQVFAKEELLKKSNLEPPQITRLLKRLGIVNPVAIDVEEAFKLICAAVEVK